MFRRILIITAVTATIAGGLFAHPAARRTRAHGVTECAQITDEQKAVIAFQRRFRPDLIDGIIDGECRAKLLALLLPRPQ